MKENRHTKKIYQRKIYSLVEKKLIRSPKDGRIYIENAPHVRIDGKMYYGNKALDYIKEHCGEEAIIDGGEELN